MNKKVQNLSEQAFIASAALVALGFGIEALARYKRIQQAAQTVLVLSGAVVAYDWVERNLLQQRTWVPYRCPTDRWQYSFKFSGELSSFRSQDSTQSDKDWGGKRQALHITGRDGPGKDENLIRLFAHQGLASPALCWAQSNLNDITATVEPEPKPAFYVDFQDNEVAVVAYEGMLKFRFEHIDSPSKTSYQDTYKCEPPKDLFKTWYRSEITLDLKTQQPTQLVWMVESLGDLRVH